MIFLKKHFAFRLLSVLGLTIWVDSKKRKPTKSTSHLHNVGTMHSRTNKSDTEGICNINLFQVDMLPGTHANWPLASPALFTHSLFMLLKYLLLQPLHKPPKFTRTKLSLFCLPTWSVLWLRLDFQLQNLPCPSFLPIYCWQKQDITFILIPG